MAGELVCWFDHKPIATYPAGHTWRNEDDGALVVLDARGNEVARHEHGAWHGFGQGVACGFESGRADPDCPNCNRKT